MLLSEKPRGTKMETGESSFNFSWRMPVEWDGGKMNLRSHFFTLPFLRPRPSCWLPMDECPHDGPLFSSCRATLDSPGEASGRRGKGNVGSLKGSEKKKGQESGLRGVVKNSHHSGESPSWECVFPGESHSSFLTLNLSETIALPKKNGGS